MDQYGGQGMRAGRGKISLGRHTFRSFKNPVYRIYYGGLLSQMVGMNMQMMTRSLLVYRLTGSAIILGAMSLANAVPMIALSLFGGVIADRVQKKYVMLAGQVASAVVSLGVALALTLGYLSAEIAGSWWILVVASVGQGAIMALMMPSRQAILPEIVDEEERMNAISLNTMGMNTWRLFAPAVAGFLIANTGFEAVYYVMAGMYLLSVVFIYFLPHTSAIAIRGGGVLTSVKEGIRYIRHETTILLVLVFTLLGVVLSMPFMQLLPVFTEDILKVGATGMGVLMSVSGAGSIVISLVLASLPNQRRGIMMLACGLLLGSALVGFSFSSSWPLSLGLIVFVGMGQMGLIALGTTLIQYYVDASYQGRVMSILMMQFGLMSLSTFAAGIVTEWVGIQWAIGGFALGLVVLSIMAMIFVPRIRKLD